MASVRVKKTKTKLFECGLPTADIRDSLNNSLVDTELARKKCGRMMILVKSFGNMINNVRDLREFTREDSTFDAYCARIAQFVIDTSQAIYGCDTLPADAENTPLRDDLSPDDFRAKYDTIRNDINIRTIILACDALEPYKMHIRNIEELNGSFLEIMPGVSFTPFADLNVKDAYVRAQDEESRKKYILVYLHKIYTYGHRLYVEYTTPDMNIEHMVSVVRESLEHLRTVPELSRCNLAFDTITDSIDLLRSNFGQYYVDFVKSQNPSTIFECFISDIARRQMDNPDDTSAPQDSAAVRARERVRRRKKMHRALLSSQFSKVIHFYQEQMRLSGKRPSSQSEMLLRRYSEVSSQLGVHNLGSGNPAAPAPSAHK